MCSMAPPRWADAARLLAVFQLRNPNPHRHLTTQLARSTASNVTRWPFTVTIAAGGRVLLQFSCIATVNASSCPTPTPRSWQYLAPARFGQNDCALAGPASRHSRLIRVLMVIGGGGTRPCLPRYRIGCESATGSPEPPSHQCPPGPCPPADAASPSNCCRSRSRTLTPRPSSSVAVEPPTCAG